MRKGSTGIDGGELPRLILHPIQQAGGQKGPGTISGAQGDSASKKPTHEWPALTPTNGLGLRHHL